MKSDFLTRRFKMKFIIFAVFSLNLFAYGLPVCKRTQQIQDAIVNTIHEQKWFKWFRETDCTFADHFLDYILYLDFSSKGITSLKVGDFAGLSSLKWLNLASNRLTSLPAGVFSDLSSLKLLALVNNNLSELPLGFFSDLNSLRLIYLRGNPLPQAEKDRIRKALPHVEVNF